MGTLFNPRQLICNKLELNSGKQQRVFPNRSRQHSDTRKIHSLERNGGGPEEAVSPATANEPKHSTNSPPLSKAPLINALQINKRGTGRKKVKASARSQDEECKEEHNRKAHNDLLKTQTYGKG